MNNLAVISDVVFRVLGLAISGLAAYTAWRAGRKVDKVGNAVNGRMAEQLATKDEQIVTARQLGAAEGGGPVALEVARIAALQTLDVAHAAAQHTLQAAQAAALATLSATNVPPPSDTPATNPPEAL